MKQEILLACVLMYMSLFKCSYVMAGMCVMSLLCAQALPAGNVLVRKRLESRLEENRQLIKAERIRPGLHCMLLGRGDSPLRMEPSAAVQWQSAGIGPVILTGIVKEIGKPFEYSIGSAVFQHSAGGRIDFSLHPRKNYGGIVQWPVESAHNGAFVESSDSVHRVGAWMQFACGESLRITPCVFESLLPGISEDDIEVQPLQTRYPARSERRRSSTFAVELQMEERGCTCSLLTALISSPAAAPSLFGRGYLQFGGGAKRDTCGPREDSFQWQYSLLGRWIGDHFTTADGELPEERASLAAMLRAGCGGNELSVKGALTRDKQPPVPDRYIVCDREISGELCWAVARLNGRAEAVHSWAFDEEGQLSGRYEYTAEIGLKENVWKASASTRCTVPHTLPIEWRQKFTCKADLGQWQLRGALSLEEQLAAWEGYLRCEYDRNELCLWMKLSLAGCREGSIETSLSLGMKLEHSEVQ